MSLHTCADAECPYFGQPTTRGCGCHKTNEQVLTEALCEMLNRLEVASEQYHNCQQWYEEKAPDGSGTLWDWVTDPATALLAKLTPNPSVSL